MRNYSSKSNKPMTRYRTPSRFKVQQAEQVKRHKGNVKKKFNFNHFNKIGN